MLTNCGNAIFQFIFLQQWLATVREIANRSLAEILKQNACRQPGILIKANSMAFHIYPCNVQCVNRFKMKEKKMRQEKIHF